MGRLTGKTVVVTGAAQGQGASHVVALSEAGADVVATDVHPDGSALVAALGRPGVAYRHLDVSSPEDWQALAGWLRDADRPVDGLVNNAGVAMRGRLEDIARADWDRALAINLTGPMLGIQTLLPLMRPGSSIVNVGSVAALTAHHAVAYTASKWALRGLSQVAAVEYGSRGIRTNLIHPGYIETPLMQGANPVFLAAHLDLTPIGRPGRPADVSPLVVYLVSDESSYVNGAEISVDGGYSAHGGTKHIIDALAAAERD